MVTYFPDSRQGESEIVPVGNNLLQSLPGSSQLPHLSQRSVSPALFGP